MTQSSEELAHLQMYTQQTHHFNNTTNRSVTTIIIVMGMWLGHFGDKNVCGNVAKTIYANTSRWWECLRVNKLC